MVFTFCSGGFDLTYLYLVTQANNKKKILQKSLVIVRVDLKNEKQNGYPRHREVWTANGVAAVGGTFTTQQGEKRKKEEERI